MMESTDREMLELAAKAAGYVILRWESFDGVDVPFVDGIGYWQPLIKNAMTDCMGDTLRLAVDLQITPSAGEVKCNAQWWVRPDMLELDSTVELTNGNPYAAICRAIVCAAAEIGKRMATHEENLALVAKLRGG